MRLYVANCTRQNQLIYYRLDFNDAGTPQADRRFQPAKQQEIPPGRQAQLGGDMHIAQIEDIVRQLTPYGLLASAEVSRQKFVAPYVFNVDKPVSADVIRRVRDVNVSVMIEQGKQLRQKAAIAVNDVVANAIANQSITTGIDPDPKGVDVSFEQLEQTEAGERRIEEGYRVRPDAPPAPSQKGPRRGKK